MSETILRAEGAVTVSESRPHANFSGVGWLTVSSRSAGAGRCDALIQFEGVPSDSREIGEARLRLVLCEACARASLLKIRRNARPFCARTVSWSTRPELAGEAHVDAAIDGANAGKYLDIDVTPLLPKDGAKRFGLTLSAWPGHENCAAFRAGGGAPILLALTGRKYPPGAGIRSVFFEDAHDLDGMGPIRSPTVCLESAERTTAFCENVGDGEVAFSLQISPDGANFLDDPQSVRLAPGEMGALTPYLFARYMRASVAGLGQIGARITFQMQTREYRAF